MGDHKVVRFDMAKDGMAAGEGKRFLTLKWLLTAMSPIWRWQKPFSPHPMVTLGNEEGRTQFFAD